MDPNNKSRTDSRVVVISDKKIGLPFSKGILASSISVTGLDILTAYEIASEIQEYFLKNKIYSLPLSELRIIAFRFIKDKVNLEYAERYLLWQSVGKLEKPIIILIGGSTGVGKSTIATIVANRLNITRGASIEAIIKRNVEEKSDSVVEGAHVVPGYLDLEEYKSRAIIQQIVISVPDKEIHKEHFTKRTVETQGSRPMDKYLKHLDKIVKIQDYIEKLAVENNVRIIENYNLDNVVNEILELILQRVKSEFSKVGSEYTKIN